jgi:hypothetical protein
MVKEWQAKKTPLKMLKSSSTLKTIVENVTFEDFLVQGSTMGGFHTVASKSHGKSCLMFQSIEGRQKHPVFF